MQPCSNQAGPHTVTARGSNWLKWVGPSMGAPSSPSDGGGVSVVDAGVSVDLLLGEHLRRGAPRPGERDLGLEPHRGKLLRHAQPEA